MSSTAWDDRTCCRGRTSSIGCNSPKTFSYEGHRNTWKVGGDALLTWIYDFFPSQQSGEYLFYPIKVNPFTL